jgi:hypothetical protein
MSQTKLTYARCAYKSFSRSARHLLLLIATHQSIETGWAYLSYHCLAEESGLTRRRVVDLVALLEANGVLEVRRGHGRGNVNFYRILREEDGLPVPHKKVKSQTPPPEKKVKFPTPPEPEKVKSQPRKSLESLPKEVDKVVNVKERKDKADTPISLSPEQAEDNGRWLTHKEAVKLGLTVGSRMFRMATGELLPGNSVIFPSDSDKRSLLNIGENFSGRKNH